jgi:hypothetical protein
MTEEAAQYETRWPKIERDLRVLKWMVGMNRVLTLECVWKLLK